MLAMDWSAQVAESRSHQAGKRHALFKVRDPAFGRWSPLAVELPPGGDADVAWISYPSWSRDGRHVYGNARNRWLVRFDVESGRLEVVADLRGFGTEWPGMTALDREDNPLITRDLTQREIVVMDLELR
jgi:hypothetical protein